MPSCAAWGKTGLMSSDWDLRKAISTTYLSVATIALPMMNSLVSTNKVVLDHAAIEPTSACSDSSMTPAAVAATVLGRFVLMPLFR